MSRNMRVLRQEADCVSDDTDDQVHDVDIDDAFCQVCGSQVTEPGNQCDTGEDSVVTGHELREVLDQLRLVFNSAAGQILHGNSAVNNGIAVHAQHVRADRQTDETLAADDQDGKRSQFRVTGIGSCFSCHLAGDDTAGNRSGSTQRPLTANQHGTDGE